MSRNISTRRIVDSDVLAVRRASRMVGVRITVMSTAVVLVVILAVFVFILSEITPSELFEPVPDPDNLDINAITLLKAAVVLGVVLIALAGLLSWLVTRRAVRPLGEALRIQRSFVADASHELRTPLTVLDARLQILQRKLPADDPSADLVIELRRDTHSLIQIVNDLLESAEAVGSSGVDARVPTGLTPAVELAVESMKLIGAERSIAIELIAPVDASMYLSATSAHRCDVALLDNALRFSPEDSIVQVIVDVGKSTATVTVRDHGPGIRGIDPARIFDRFAHSGAAINFTISRATA
ncbi:HAMP domain-containing sensor histidine kinase [Glaciihabitans sp. UYNi722]|uniref:sensor histidine kinase n=1 Tax=Glaciihabitans sp. UYNi722 TaxID=3156344 RepID=UPI003394A040